MSKRGESAKSLPKMIKVAPTLTDPSMKSDGKSDTDELLREMGADDEETEDIRKTVFDSKKKTKEEAQAAAAPQEQGTSMLLIVVFALIVIVLVSLIVWMMMKQNDPKPSGEGAVRSRVRPHNRNAMPPVGPGSQFMYQGRLYQYDQFGQAHLVQQQAPNAPNAQPVGEPAASVPVAAPAGEPAERKVTFADQKVASAPAVEPKVDPTVQESKPSVLKPTAGPSVTEVDIEYKAMRPTVPAPPKEESKLLMAGPVSKQELDSLLQKTNDMINESSELTEEDRTLLDKVTSDTYDDDEEEDESA